MAIRDRYVFDNAARKPVDLESADSAERHPKQLKLRKIWLPKLLYDALPYFYLVAGVAAFLTTLYISEWFWVLPHYLLFSAACLHLGIYIVHRRRRR